MLAQPQQQIENNEPQRKLDEIYQSLEEINTQSQALGSNIELENQKILLFFGFEHLDVNKFYAHFQEKNVIARNDYIQIVKLQQEQKTSYLINTPYSLEGINYEKLCIQQCITRIILKNILQNFKDCEYHLIVNFNKLNGQTQQEQLNQITDFRFFNFDQFSFKQDNVSLIFENGGELQHCIVNVTKKQDLQFNNIQEQETLKTIFKANKFSKIQNEKLQDYGPMSMFLLTTMDDYVKQLNTILRNYQDQLQWLQQIPNLENEQDLKNCIINLLRKLKKFFENKFNYNLNLAEELFMFINSFNQSHREIIEKCLKNMGKILDKFLNYKNIEQQNLIPNILVDEDKIEFINQMFRQYYSKEFLSIKIYEIRNLYINIKCWHSYSSEMVESIISNFNQIVQHIDEGFEQEREYGVFLFGKSKVGKSTLMNLLKNPDSLKVAEIVDQLCYAIKKGYQTEFDIGHTLISQTQKILSMQIGDVWFYDCPGFDNNILNNIRIAHRISLYNYLVRTKKVIGFFFIDSQIRNALIIKDTIDPIYDMLKDKNQIIKENQKWASLVLVKTRKNTRNSYIQSWDELYEGMMEGQYKFYKEMYQNDNQCIEFPQADINLQSEQILEQNTSIREKVLKIVNENRQQQDFKLNFQLGDLGDLVHLYGTFLKKIQIKIQQIVDLLENYINTYVLESNDTLEDKEKVVQNLNSFMEAEINQNNITQILSKIMEWLNKNDKFKFNTIFLQRQIAEMLQCLKIDNYIQTKTNIIIRVDTSILKKNAEKIISLIKDIAKLEFGLKAGFLIFSITSIVLCFGTMLLAVTFLTSTIMEAIGLQVARRVALQLAITRAITGLTEAGASTITYIVFEYSQGILKSKYESYLKEQEQRNEL